MIRLAGPVVSSGSPFAPQRLDGRAIHRATQATPIGRVEAPDATSANHEGQGVSFAYTEQQTSTSLMQFENVKTELQSLVPGTSKLHTFQARGSVGKSSSVSVAENASPPSVDTRHDASHQAANNCHNDRSKSMRRCYSLWATSGELLQVHPEGRLAPGSGEPRPGVPR